MVPPLRFLQHHITLLLIFTFSDDSLPLIHPQPPSELFPGTFLKCPSPTILFLTLSPFPQLIRFFFYPALLSSSVDLLTWLPSSPVWSIQAMVLTLPSDLPVSQDQTFSLPFSRFSTFSLVIPPPSQRFPRLLLEAFLYQQSSPLSHYSQPPFLSPFTPLFPSLSSLQASSYPSPSYKAAF